MKKILAVLLVVCFLVMPMLCYGQSGDTHSQIIYTEVINNTSGAGQTTVIPITKIRPNVDKIVGMQVFCINGASSGIGAIYDFTTSSVLTAGVEVICEFEATTNYPMSIFFPFPRYIVNGVVVVQENNTQVVVYYIRN